LKIILENHFDDPEYLEKKVRELIIEAQYALKQRNILDYHEKMQKVVSVAVMARGIRMVTNKFD